MKNNEQEMASTDCMPPKDLERKIEVVLTIARGDQGRPKYTLYQLEGAISFDIADVETKSPDAKRTLLVGDTFTGLVAKQIESVTKYITVLQEEPAKPEVVKGLPVMYTDTRLLESVEAMRRADAWGQNPDWTRNDWQFEVANGETQLGYWQWVSHKIEGCEETKKR